MEHLPSQSPALENADHRSNEECEPDASMDIDAPTTPPTSIPNCHNDTLDVEMGAPSDTMAVIEDDNMSMYASESENAPLTVVTTTDGKENINAKVNKSPDDILGNVERFYRILELISEQGSGGLVDKIIIDQDSLSEFINNTCPNAYASLTKVNFKSLDSVTVLPIGVYGPQESIVSFLLTVGILDHIKAREILTFDERTSRRLQSGIYVAVPPGQHDSSTKMYIVYWPERTTWDDDAIHSVRRNRVTFMRYLSKVVDQTICLLGDKDIIWNDESFDEEDMDVNENMDRLFSFEVAKTLEQEESVTTRTGFEIVLPPLSNRHTSTDATNVTPSPRIMTGELNQGYIAARHIGALPQRRELSNNNINCIFLRKELEEPAIRIHESFTDQMLEGLIKYGLSDRFPRQCRQWTTMKEDLDKELAERKSTSLQEAIQELESANGSLKSAFDFEFMKRLKDVYPRCNFTSLTDPRGNESNKLDMHTMTTLDESATAVDPISDSHPPKESNLGDAYQCLVTIYPQIKDDFRKAFDKVVNNNKKLSPEYQKLKKHLITLRVFLEDYPNLKEIDRARLSEAIFSDSDNDKDLSDILGSTGDAAHGLGFGLVDTFKNAWNKATGTPFQNQRKVINGQIKQINDADFLRTIDESNYHGLADTAIVKIFEVATRDLLAALDREKELLIKRARAIQLQQCESQVELVVSAERQTKYNDLRVSIIKEIELASGTGGDNNDTLYLQLLSQNKVHGSYSTQPTFKMTAQREFLSQPTHEYTIYTLSLTAEDRHNIQLDSKCVPRPQVNARFSTSFKLPTDNIILHSQLLTESMILLILDDGKEIAIYLDSLTNISNSVTSKRTRKIIHHEKIGNDVIPAFDEGRRLLALFSVNKVDIFAHIHCNTLAFFGYKFMLHVFSFDENFTAIQTWAQPINLSNWYSPSQIINHVCFVSGFEELLLVDDCGQARIYSLTTQQCRPATLELHHRPCAILPSPDGACFVAIFDHDTSRVVRAYHWATFGSNDGITLNVEIGHNDYFSLTSFVNRSSVHLVVVDKDLERCTSTVLDITKKATEFMFQEKTTRKAEMPTSNIAQHNCLLDCHADVWTRFPVLPAVQRCSGVSDTRHTPSLTFFAKKDQHRFAPYFSDLIKSFEQKTRKPTGALLRSIVVSSMQSSDFGVSYLNQLGHHNVSRFQLGEWIVGLLCLIPIHIAVTRENRFIPLKDGVTSTEYEKSLLGAEVSTVVDSISFGWYESILQTYMSTKPVKVVSSMGEQSVGKSYALNHLADTSFAGSAMRTTEGVWMSITPTDDFLLVSLDFEGVHSIERSAQEDTLLVLFNTAISNLVLFRNNFALSRDITGLFQSFQSSSSVFDPAANPTLFRSTLVIIIKDVGDPDKKEIVREFSLKFQKIVQEEQESNFISRLHAGQLNIIPWPVIESKQFYTLFPAIKLYLDKQPVTHTTAGHFLHTLKTIMAKLKANDWRALSQSMAAHRTSQLLAILPNALAYGTADPGGYSEPLKDLDTDDHIIFSDSSSVFFLSGTGSQPAMCETLLQTLCRSWHDYDLRGKMNDPEWLESLSTHLAELVESRVQYVRTWLDKNLEKFQDDNAQITAQTSITALHRLFDATVLDLKGNVELCKQQCSSCQLSCLLSRRHEDKSHDCLTSHRCSQQCEFTEDHPEELKICGYPAGHSGKHVCVVDAHLCGEPCFLKDKSGCLGECTQVAGHLGDEHQCSANVHYCGMPCQLATETLSGPYTCSSTCTVPSDQPHVVHICDDRNCPIKCSLCSRLCASSNHLHAMEDDAVHLCGEEHPCRAFCTAKGVCEIDTAPQSIEATFTGRHQTFQYTKYSQVAKRLPCVIPIPPMEVEHHGQHCHTKDPKSFHFCETRCGQCGYYCTLPLGHSQKEHETSHGSMSKSRWALETHDTVIELNGRKFGSDDEGAPMMCNLVCQDMGRHVHVDYCRAGSAGNCNAPDTQHIKTRMQPNPSQPKDWVTHELHWKRLGFKDPYSRDDKNMFAKCDAMCSGPEHTSSNSAQPSYCTLPMFHLPRAITSQGTGLGYVSNDGHLFSCKNPAVLQQAFHVIFVIDRSGSMSYDDRRPLPGTPVTNKITLSSNNRLGAVYSSLYAFWASRMSAVTSGNNAHTNAIRRDSYSVILFDHTAVKCIVNDFTRSPEQLIDALLPYRADGGTSYDVALTAAKEVMTQYWATERSPVVILLSDGECSIADSTMQTFCRSAITLGQPVSFHGVSFGPNNGTLRRMVQIAREIQNGVPRDPLRPATAVIESSFAEALDSVRLAETFLGIAESLKKPRGSLFQG